MGSLAKPEEVVYLVRPSGWEADPAEERFKLSLFDPIILVVYCHFALYLRLEDDSAESRVKVARVMRQGLAKTLSQVRHLCGKLEKDPEGGFSFVKKRDTAVKFVVKMLDAPEYPSIDDIEKASFSCSSLRDLKAFALQDLPYGEGRPESNPNNHPTTSGFQLNFVRGGAVLSSHVHHWATDVVGWSNFVRQLADNCRAIHSATDSMGVVASTEQDEAAALARISYPPWDPASIDVSRFTRPAPPSEQLIDGPPVVARHPGHPKEQQALLFHLPRSRAEQIKAMAQPRPRVNGVVVVDDEDGSGPSWVSTYDAMCAFIWRHLTRARVPFYQPDLNEPMAWFGESVNMRPRFRDPAPTPPRMIRNMLAGGFSEVATQVKMPSVREVVGAEDEAPLARLAQYVRQITDSVTQKHVEGLLEYIAMLRDQQSVSFNLMSKPPMSFFVTDHRPADVSSCDFGFGFPLTHRFLTGDDISLNMTLVYPATRSCKESDGDEGTIWSITMEKAVVPALLNDVEWSRYFEYRGID